MKESETQLHTKEQKKLFKNSEDKPSFKESIAIKQSFPDTLNDQRIAELKSEIANEIDTKPVLNTSIPANTETAFKKVPLKRSNSFF